MPRSAECHSRPMSLAPSLALAGALLMTGACARPGLPDGTRCDETLSAAVTAYLDASCLRIKGFEGVRLRDMSPAVARVRGRFPSAERPWFLEVEVTRDRVLVAGEPIGDAPLREALTTLLDRERRADRELGREDRLRIPAIAIAPDVPARRSAELLGGLGPDWPRVALLFRPPAPDYPLIPGQERIDEAHRRAWQERHDLEARLVAEHGTFPPLAVSKEAHQHTLIARWAKPPREQCRAFRDAYGALATVMPGSGLAIFHFPRETQGER